MKEKRFFKSLYSAETSLYAPRMFPGVSAQHGGHVWAAHIRRLASAAAAMLVLIAASIAGASQREAPDREAMKACLVGDYVKGIEILADLFIDSRDPTHIFNQGRCYEQNSRYEDAIARFREYLRKATAILPADRALAEKHIADCQAFLATSIPLAQQPPKPAPALVERPPLATTAPENHPGLGLRIAGIGCGVMGLTSVGIGIYYYTHARSLSDRINPTEEIQQKGKRAESMQWLFFSVGGAGLVSGIVLYVLGSRSIASSETASSTITPVVGPGWAGLSAQGVF